MGARRRLSPSLAALHRELDAISKTPSMNDAARPRWAGAGLIAAPENQQLERIQCATS